MNSTSLGHAIDSVLPAMRCQLYVAFSSAERALEGNLHIWHHGFFQLCAMEIGLTADLHPFNVAKLELPC